AAEGAVSAVSIRARFEGGGMEQRNGGPGSGERTDRTVWTSTGCAGPVRPGRGGPLRSVGTPKAPARKGAGRGGRRGPSEDHQGAASLAREHVLEGGRDAVQGDALGHQGAEVEAAGADVLAEGGQVAGRVGVAVDAAGQGAAPVEDLQSVEGDLLVLAADADDRGAAAATRGLPGGADGGPAPGALDGHVDALLAGEGADLAGCGVGGDEVVGGAGRAG